jgi:hypothetical protein
MKNFLQDFSQKILDYLLTAILSQSFLSEITTSVFSDQLRMLNNLRKVCPAGLCVMLPSALKMQAGEWKWGGPLCKVTPYTVTTITGEVTFIFLYDIDIYYPL